jgi:hypothetical protein
MGRRVILVVLLVAGLAPSAEAAELLRARECQGPKTCNAITIVRYRAVPGETNDLTVRYGDGTFVFTDQAPLAAPRGCTARSDREVACPADRADVALDDGPDVATIDAGVAPTVYTGYVTVDAGPGDDRVAAMRAAVRGGDGDDTLSGGVLEGGAGADTLTGTGGDDSLIGGGGVDTLAGGDGNDALTGGEAADVMDGGPGSDTVSYGGHEAPVRIDIASQTSGDGDRLSGFENAHGGSGDDVLIGDDGPNVLAGGTGRDTVLGGAGDDTVTSFSGGRLDGGEGDDVVDAVMGATSLEGGPGDDRVSGGFGVDQFSGGDGDDVFEISYVAVLGKWREKVRCGAGDDVVLRPYRALVRPDCESVMESDEVGAQRLPAYPRGGRLALPRGLRRGRVELRLDRHVRPFATLPFERVSSVRLRIPRRIRRLPRDPLRIAIRIVGDRRCWGWVIDLRPP